MKFYVTARFKGSTENKEEIEKLCQVVREAGHEDFHFIRDVEKYQPNFFKNQKEVWAASKRFLEECDALLVDVTDQPSGGRIVEVGMAFAMNKPIYVIAKKGTPYKDFYAGVAASIFEYGRIEDVAQRLKVVKTPSTK